MICGPQAVVVAVSVVVVVAASAIVAKVFRGFICFYLKMILECTLF